ncbi:uncharacterized protein LMH87_008031 [Akanthomyces muscarius]|uniref:Uncharacterized protein n=1 Tax=Akanthomyces muscarius TaxID=2231603 RepID=A0A9W8QJM5_AKAMU|nr:uncharacterized protein LMH87_008031 [Akanthomyces muscarius]KAJ4159116.1 hypothetical protein LMH87_008031 [Akanthomyces muscarius]
MVRRQRWCAVAVRVGSASKDGTTFKIDVPAPPEDATAEQGAHVAPQSFAFEVHGDQLMLRSADRANRKFKQHFLKNL